MPGGPVSGGHVPGSGGGPAAPHPSPPGEAGSWPAVAPRDEVSRLGRQGHGRVSAHGGLVSDGLAVWCATVWYPVVWRPIIRHLT